MNSAKILPFIKGSITFLPGVKQILSLKPGSAVNSHYCYTVWMRHLSHWAIHRSNLPKVVAEIGVGASLGTCLAALLSGCEKVYALEVVHYWNTKRNLRIFDELVTLFRERAAIPNSTVFPKVRPLLNNYDFPAHILTEERLKAALAPQRLAIIRKELADLDNPNNTMIQYYVPWNEATVIQENSVDFIFSQAVLQSVNNLDLTYRAINQWIKPNGLMSHCIDFKSFNSTVQWNGHWSYSPSEWKIIMGGRSFLINRQPYSSHINWHRHFGFKVLTQQVDQKENKLKRRQLAPDFQWLLEEDLTTSSCHLLSQK